MKDWRDHGGGGGAAVDAKAKPPVQYTTFPRASDSFDVAVAGTTVRATHAESGAQFTVDTAAAAQASAAAPVKTAPATKPTKSSKK
jgi:hypothetical protein